MLPNNNYFKNMAADVLNKLYVSFREYSSPTCLQISGKSKEGGEQAGTRQMVRRSRQDAQGRWLGGGEEIPPCPPLVILLFQNIDFVIGIKSEVFRFLAL